MDAKIKKWSSLPTNLSDFVCAVPLAAIECKALAGILPERCPRLEQIQLSLETDAAGAEQLLDMLPCFLLLTSLHIDVSNTTHPPTLQHLVRTLTVILPSPSPFPFPHSLTPSQFLFIVNACASPFSHLLDVSLC